MMRHAVVLGASMAGLGAARALSSHFDRVTIVERDALRSETRESRKGVPQGNHGHGLLASGYRVLDAYFPGMMREIVDAGASPGDVTGDFLWYQFGAWKLRTDSGLGGIIVSRPFLEAKVRERVRALENVTLLSEHDGVEPIFDAEERRVTGMRVKDRSNDTEHVLEADLVVDAAGRGSLTPNWLASWGFGEVKQSLVRCDVGYATNVFERRAGDFHGSVGGVIVGTPPHERRGGALFAVEGNRWIVTLFGALGDHPGSEPTAFKDFARSLPVPDLFELVCDREPIASGAQYKFPANRRCHFDELARFPDGYLVLGDGICSFNPVYGQGMSVALCEAKALDECLGAGMNGLAKRFFARAAVLIANPWTIATGEDLRFPEVEGARPPGFGLLSSFMARAHRAATKDPVVLTRFFEVANLLRAPTAMLSPEVAMRVLVGGIGSGQSSVSSKV
jgi:2-polyprenyl-6-methoxyphenol hydroxylase-like FAD-dependent oxidoreductase